MTVRKHAAGLESKEVRREHQMEQTNQINIEGYWRDTLSEGVEAMK